MTNHRFKPEGQCYFLPMGIGYCEILRLVREGHTGACYPERTMTQMEIITTKPFLPSIVTENAWIVGLYDRENVFVWCNKSESWRNPNMQTYGGDVSWVWQNFLGVRSTIPYQVLGGQKAADKLIADLKAAHSKLK